MFIFFFWRISLFNCHKSAGVEGTWNRIFQRRDGARQFFFPWSEGSGYHSWHLFLKTESNCAFWNNFHPIACVGWFLFCFLGFFLGGGGGGVGVAINAPKWRVCDCGLFSLCRGIMPDEEGPTISLVFLKKTSFHENEEFMFSKPSKMTIFRFFICYFGDWRLLVLKIIQC